MSRFCCAASVAVVLAGWAVCGAQDSAPAASLLPNPSFEESHPDGVRGWTPRAWQGEEDGRWNVGAGQEQKHAISN